MALLFLDTSGPRCAALVRRPGRDDVVAEEVLGRGHDSRLAPIVQTVLEQAGIAPADLARVAVAVGPGSFTGVRVGVAFARGLALSLDIPSVGINTLDALAASAPDTPGLVVAAEDVKRGEVIWRLFADGAPLGAPDRAAAADAVAAIAGMANGAPVSSAGTGAPLIASQSIMDTGVRIFDLVRAADLGEAADPAAAPATPFYARPPDAKLPGGVDPWA